MEDGEKNDGNGSSTESKKQQVETKSLTATSQSNKPATFEMEIDDENGCIRVPSVDFCTKQRCGFVCLLMSVAILTIVVLLTVWPKCPPPDTDTVCRTPRCRSISAKILVNVNETVDPCGDMWEFSCGQWLTSNPIPRSRGFWSTSLQAEQRVKEKIRVLLGTKEMEENSVDLKVKHFYDSCMGVPEIQIGRIEGMSDFIRDLGLWIPNKKFIAENYNFQPQLNKKHGVDGGSPFFRVDVLPDPDRNFSQNIIRIRPAMLSLPHQFYDRNPNDTIVIRYKTYVKEVLALAKANPNDAAWMAQIIYEFETRIANVISGHRLDYLNLNSSHPNDFGSWRKIDLGDLKSAANAVDWVKFLGSIFRETNITDNTSVLVTSMDYLKGVSQIISSSEPKALNTYMIWELLNHYVPYISRDFASTFERFRLSLRGGHEPIPRWEFCVDETVKIFSPIVSTWLSEESQDRDEKAEKVRQITQDIHESFIDENTRRSSLDLPVIRKLAIYTVNRITYTVGTPNLEKENLTNLYKSLNVHPKEFLENMIRINKFKLKQLEMNLKNETNTFLPFLQMFPPNPFKVDFIPSQSIIIIPETVLLRNDLLVEYRSIPLGSLGVEIGEAIANILCFDFGFCTEDETFLSLDHESFELLQSLSGQPWDLDCNPRNASRKNRTVEEVTWIEGPHLTGVLHNVGFDIAMTAVKFLESAKSKQPHLPFLEEFDPLGIFLISYVQSQCSSTTKEFSNVDASRLISITGKERVKNIVKYSSAFSESFHCRKFPTNSSFCSARLSSA